MPNPLAELEVFFTVVETGSFSAAGRKLLRTPSTISKVISGMERRLGARLFERTPRALVLTAAGRTLHLEGEGVFEAVANAENAVLKLSNSVAGTLKVHSLLTFAKYQLAPILGEFLRAHPGLRVELQLGNEPVDLVQEKIDVAIQSGDLPDSSLVARRLTASRWIICASPQYLETFGEPTTPEQLAHHNCLNFTHRTHWNAWPLVTPNGASNHFLAKGNVGSNQGEMLLELARQGIGIVRLAEFHIADDLRTGKLVRLLDEYSSDLEEPIFVIYQSRKHLNPRIRAFLAFLDQKFKPPA